MESGYYMSELDVIKVWTGAVVSSPSLTEEDPPRSSHSGQLAAPRYCWPLVLCYRALSCQDSCLLPEQASKSTTQGRSHSLLVTITFSVFHYWKQVSRPSPYSRGGDFTEMGVMGLHFGIASLS